MISIRGAGSDRPLQGVFLPAATPFDHRGELYPAKLKHNLGKWNQTAVSGYVVGGSTGESAALTAEERITLLSLAAEHAAPDKILVAGAAARGVRETVSLVNRAAELGYAAALLETPCCYPDAGAQELYFRAVADQSAVPVIVAGQPPEAAASLARHPNIVAAVVRAPDEAARLKDCMAVLAGWEDALWDCLRAGAAGAVLPTAGAAPYSAVTVWEAHRGRRAETGLDWQGRIAPAARLAWTSYGIPGLKHAMDINGYYGGPCRLPLAPLAPRAKLEIEAAFRELRG